MVGQVAAFQAIGQVGGMVGQATAAGRAKEAAYAQAALYERQMEHEIRRTRRSHRLSSGRMRASVYASNIDMSGSALKHVQEQNKLMAKDIRMMKYAKREGVHAIRKGAQLQHDASKWQAMAQGFNAMGSAFQAYSGAKATFSGGAP